MLSQDAMRLLERIDGAAEAMAAHSANVAELATGLKLNGVVYSGTVQIGASGRKLIEARSNFASATVRPAGADVVISTQGDSGDAPTSGPGVFLIPGGIERTVAVAGNVLVLYGTAGSKVAVTLWVRPQAPESSQSHPAAVDCPAGPQRIVGAAASTTLAAANPARRGLAIYNDNAAAVILYVCWGPVASTVLYTVQLVGGAYYELPQPCYRGIVTGIWSAASGAAQVSELQ